MGIFRGRYVALVGLACASTAFGEQGVTGPRMPRGDVDAYRVESQYGAPVAVLNPLFPRDDKLEVGGGGVYSGMSSLMGYKGWNASAVWHFNRRHALEPIAFGRLYGNQGSFVREQITAKPQSNGKRSTLGIEIPQQYIAASYMFSPYYSKMHLGWRAVSHFDVYFGAGFGFLKNRTEFLDGTPGVDVNRPAVSLAVGTRFLILPRFALRLELRDFIHQMTNFRRESTGNTLQISASAHIFFGAFRNPEE
jgi:outer membrane beta-barrel protein